MKWKGKNPEEPQWELRVKTRKLPKARENAGNQLALGASFASDWLRKRREFPGPIKERIKAKTNAIEDYFRHSVKNLLYSSGPCCSKVG